MKRGAVILICLLGMGCAQNPRHQLAVTSQVVAQSLFATQDAEEAAYKTRGCSALVTTNCISAEAHQRFNAHLVDALTLGKAFNLAVRGWDHDRPLPEELGKLKDVLFALTAELTTKYPEDVRVQIMATLTATYDAILAVLAAVGR